MSDNDRGCMAGGLALGILIGALAGLAVGVLYAPKSGRETREMIRERADETVQAIREKAEATRDRAGDMVHSVKSRIHGEGQGEPS